MLEDLDSLYFVNIDNRDNSLINEDDEFQSLVDNHNHREDPLTQLFPLEDIDNNNSISNSLNSEGINNNEESLNINNIINTLNQINENEYNISSTNSNSNSYKKNKNKIFEITKDENKKKAKLLNKKRNPEKKYIHSKDVFDNASRKIKSRLFEAINIILNKALEEDERKNLDDNVIKNKKLKGKTKIGEMPYKKGKGFFKIDSDIKQSTDVKKNIELLNKTIKEIYCGNVSKKAANCSNDKLNYNKNFIQEIEHDPGKIKTKKILEHSFMDCLAQFRKTITIPELEGLEEEYDSFIKELKEKDEDYALNVEGYIKNYEILTLRRKPRNKRKKTEKDDINQNKDNYNINKYD